MELRENTAEQPGKHRGAAKGSTAEQSREAPRSSPGKHRGAVQGNEAAVTSPTGTQAVDRAAQLLREVVRCGDPVTFTELTAATGLAKSTTSRLLMALER